MCNRARLRTDPETLVERFGAKWAAAIPNRWPIELTPCTRAPVIRSAESQRIIDLMAWNVLGGQAPWPMTNVRNLKLPQWRGVVDWLRVIRSQADEHARRESQGGLD